MICQKSIVFLLVNNRYPVVHMVNFVICTHFKSNFIKYCIDSNYKINVRHEKWYIPTKKQGHDYWLEVPRVPHVSSSIPFLSFFKVTVSGILYLPFPCFSFWFSIYLYPHRFTQVVCIIQELVFLYILSLSSSFLLSVSRPFLLLYGISL